MYTITFASGITTTMTADELIARKPWLLAIGADWHRI